MSVFSVGAFSNGENQQEVGLAVAFRIVGGDTNRGFLVTSQ